MRTCLAVLLSTLMAHAAIAGTEYTEVDFKEFRLSPEDYKSKKITYTARFVNVSTTFLPYMDKSGFTTKKYLWLVVGDFRIPAMLKKSDEATELVVTLKKEQLVTVSGTVKTFKSKPKQTMYPQYYVMVDSIEPSADPAPFDKPPPRK
ncbi:MAG: hypothetical protein L6437_09575 [Kiritimatiellae bacterium]|nr:hypothetical protein [Kiritimatiellia bacterium]